MIPCFTKETIEKVMNRLGLTGEKGEAEATRILWEWGYTGGDVDDLLDRYEDEEVY